MVAKPDRVAGSNMGTSRDNLWRVWESLPPDHRPWLLCGDSGYGNEALINDCEGRGQKYLFRLRSSTGVKQLIKLLERKGGWRPGVNGWSGIEGQLQFDGWSRKRSVIVLRRLKRHTTAPAATDARALPLPELRVNPKPAQYEYQVLVTNLTNCLAVPTNKSCGNPQRGHPSQRRRTGLYPGETLLPHFDFLSSVFQAHGLQTLARDERSFSILNRWALSAKTSAGKSAPVGPSSDRLGLSNP